MRYLPRPRELEAVRSKLRRVPVTALLGPPQCGKTTLAQSLEAEHFFDLEDPRSLVRLDEPQTALEGLTGTVVIDEVQRKPDLFPLLRVLADRQQAVRYLLLGSASPDLVKEVSESLAGRVAYHAPSGHRRWRSRVESYSNRGPGRSSDADFATLPAPLPPPVPNGAGRVQARLLRGVLPRLVPVFPRGAGCRRSETEPHRGCTEPFPDRPPLQPLTPSVRLAIGQCRGSA